MSKSVSPTVSIIVPIFNVEKYIRKCVDSILVQTYHKLEIILVDDGSQDACSLICDEYKHNDCRVVVIHKENGGLSDARNSGLDVASGDYITFIDGDDWYAPDAIEILVKAVTQYNATIACMRNASVSTDYSTIEKVPNTKSIDVVSSLELLKKICEKKYSTSVCNKLFKTELWSNIRFQKGRLNEDFLSLCLILMDENRVVTIEYPGYFYYNRPTSLTRSESVKIRPVQDAIINSLELKKRASKIQPMLESSFARIGLYQARTLLFILPKQELRKESFSVNLIINCLNECGSYIFSANLSMTDKIILLMAKYCPIKTALFIQKFYKLREVIKWK